MMSQDHVIKVLYDFMGESPLWQVTILPIFVIIGIVVVEIWSFYWLKGNIPHVLASFLHFCLFPKYMAYHALIHEISERRHNS